MKEERGKKLIFLCGEVRLTVFDDQKQVDADQACQDGGDDPDMCGEEALQGKCA